MWWVRVKGESRGGERVKDGDKSSEIQREKWMRAKWTERGKKIAEKGEERNNKMRD